MRYLITAVCLIASPALAQDCNSNGVPDPSDIALGYSTDCNGNGVPDECDFGQITLLADFDSPPAVPFTTFPICHVTTACRPPGGGASGAYAYFGFDATCNYENGQAVGGRLRLENVPLPARSKVILQYWQYFWGEHGGSSFCDYGTEDRTTIWVDGNFVHNNCDESSTVEWRIVSVDLSDFAGSSVRIDMDFWTGDWVANSYYGWAVDDVRLITFDDVSANGVPDPCERISVTYCGSNPNSTGVVAGLGALGSENVADEDLFLRTVFVPQKVFGYYLMSTVQGATPLPAPSQGILCLGFPIVRFNTLPEHILFSGTLRELNMRVDFPNLPQQTVFQPGETWNFQCWFRDGAASNTSRGVAVAFQ